jgi:hypothetical protein
MKPFITLLMFILTLVSCSMFEKEETPAESLAPQFDPPTLKRGKTSSQCWIRSSPSITEENKMFVIKKGVSILYTRENAEFMRIHTEHNSGFVSNSCLEFPY